MEERNNMENLIGKFGSTQWESPIDEEDAKWYNGGNGIQGHQSLVGKVISDDGEILAIFFGDRTMRFYKKDFKVYKTPDFVRGGQGTDCRQEYEW